MMLSSVVRYSDDAAGLEKSLRLFQYLSQTGKAILATSLQSSKPWAQAHSQFALARRYFRLLKWHGSWGVASQQVNTNQGSLITLLEVSKWSFLGLYLFVLSTSIKLNVYKSNTLTNLIHSFLEMFTITNAIGMTNYNWGPAVQHEANKCWLYAIVSSIFVSLYQLFFTTAVPIPTEVQNTKSEAKDKEETSAAAPVRTAINTDRSKIYRQLAIDCADVIIPAVGVGWLDWDEVYVGVAGTISSILAGQEVWRRIQSQVASVET